MHAGGVLLLSPFLAVAPRLGELGVGELLGFGGAGRIQTVAFLAYFRALKEGPVAVVTPVVSAYAAVVLVLAIVFFHERPSIGQLIGIGVTVTGVILVATDLRTLSRIRIGRGVLFGLAALVSFGYVLFFIAKNVPEFSWFLPPYLVRLFTALPLLALAAARQTWPWQARSRAVRWWMILLAVLDCVGVTCYGLGVSRGAASVVATAASSYSMVPIVFGVVFLRERLAPNQSLGIVVVLSGLVTLGIAS
jgi:drug/metabolite transporter (DMT)-like permease